MDSEKTELIIWYNIAHCFKSPHLVKTLDINKTHL